VIVKEINARSILTRSGLPGCDFSANPYRGCPHACLYCYASYMAKFTASQAPWGEFLDIKNWPEIKNPQKYAGKTIFIGSATDPYCPQEATALRTRRLLLQLKDSGARLSILTKSDLILRDLDLLKTIPGIRAGLSINTLSEEIRAQTDRASRIERRLEALKILHEAGVRTFCFIAPVLPGISDPRAVIKALGNSAGAVWLDRLNLRGRWRDGVIAWVRQMRPDLSGLYAEIYERGSQDYWLRQDLEIAEFCRGQGLEFSHTDDGALRPWSAPPIVTSYLARASV
jgi:DNA repair photolyase